MEIFMDIMNSIFALLAGLMKALGVISADENNAPVENPEFVAADNEATNVLNND